MLKYLIVLISLNLILIARDNPFLPVNSTQGLTTNQIQNVTPLKKISVTLPSTARELESVTFKYKNLDGSLSSKTITLENSIDWHIPIFVSQNYNIDKSIQRKDTKTFKKIVSWSFIKFYEQNKQLKIVTKDELLRDFLLVKPHRVVCDFKRELDIRSLNKDITNSLFKKIKIGAHLKFYRVVIELDGYYKYNIRKIKNGYLLKLK